MKMQDISVKKRLMIANFLMVFVPVCLLMLIGGLSFMGFKHSETGYRLLTIIAPEKTSIFATQYVLGKLRNRVEKDDHLSKLVHSCHLLEAQGIKTAIIKNGQILYTTNNIDVNILARIVQHRLGRVNAGELWNEKGLAFYYTSPNSKITVLAASDRSFFKRGESQDNFIKKVVEIILYTTLILTITVIILLGRYLARLIAEQIAQYDNKRKELIVGISHDLATPLTALKGYISGIRDGIANTPSKRQHYLDMMDETVITMTHLVDSLFLFSKLDLGRVDFHTEPVKIYNYFADFVEEKSAALAERGINLKLAGKSNEAQVKIDYSQFSRVVDNLVENSFKYKRNENVTVEICVENQNNNVKITFSDDGIGVDDLNLPKLFEIFYRTDKARTNVEKGSGLGLAIVRQIITAMNGQVYAEHSHLNGLAIIINLPEYRGVKHEENINN